MQDNVEIYDTSSDFEVSWDIQDGSFDNSFQMNKFLKFIQRGRKKPKVNKNHDFNAQKDQELDQLIHEGFDLDEGLLGENKDRSEKNNSISSEQYSRPEIKEDDQKYSRKNTNKYQENSRTDMIEEGEDSRPGISLSNKENSFPEEGDSNKNISNLEEDKRNGIAENNEHILDMPMEVDFAGSSQSQSPTLEMIQEEAEVDETTKLKESDFASAEKITVPEARLKKSKTDLGSIKEDLTPELVKLKSEMNNNEAYEKRKEEIMQKVMQSTYSSMNSFKKNMFDSLDMNKSKVSSNKSLFTLFYRRNARAWGNGDWCIDYYQ